MKSWDVKKGEVGILYQFKPLVRSYLEKEAQFCISHCKKGKKAPREGSKTTNKNKWIENSLIKLF